MAVFEDAYQEDLTREQVRAHPGMPGADPSQKRVHGAVAGSAEGRLVVPASCYTRLSRPSVALRYASKCRAFKSARPTRAGGRTHSPQIAGAQASGAVRSPGIGLQPGSAAPACQAGAAQGAVVSALARQSSVPRRSLG